MTRRRRRVEGPTWVWLLDGALAVTSIALYLAVTRLSPGSGAGVRIPWPALAVGFALAEILVVHVQFRRNAFSFSFSELPLVVGMFFTAPNELVIAQALGVAAVLVLHRRQSAQKLVFNVGMSALQAEVAVLVLHALAGSRPELGPVAAGACFLGTASNVLLSDVAISVAISSTEGRWQLASSLPMLGVTAVAVSASTALGVVTALILADARWAAGLLLIPAATLFGAYRAFTSQREQRESLEFLFEAMRILDTRRVEHAVVDLLERVREMFRAEYAELILFPVDGGAAPLRTRCGPEGPTEVVEPVDLIAFGRTMRRALIRGEPALLAGERAAGILGGVPVRDAMFAPLLGERRTLGAIVVANRLGEVSTFDEEDLNLFRTLVSHASISIENGHLGKALAELSEVERERARLLDGVVGAAEEERTRLAAELHDGPVQRLAALAYSLDRVRLNLTRGEAANALRILDESQSWLGDEVDGLRRVMADLRPPILDERGLLPALSGFAEQFERETAIHASVDGDTERLPEAHETVLYRLVQEALTNVRKHSHAERVAISLRRDGAEIVLLVKDDGVGFDPGTTRLAIDANRHFGLSVMRERVEMAGGRWEIRSRPGAGTTIVAALPMDPAPETEPNDRNEEAIDAGV
jgi:signal transduction histidine kinase